MAGEIPILQIGDCLLVSRDLFDRICRSVRGGVQALEVLRGNASVDLLFSDVLMPGGVSGVALATKARQIRRGLKVLLTSGYPAGDSDRVGTAEFPLIQKPYQRDKLALMLRVALDPIERH